MSFEACASLVERGDPDRFAAAMASPPATRSILFPLYAFNIEVSRAPWVTQEPMIAEMRLQWWADALDEIASGDAVRKHEVVTPLAGFLDAESARILRALVEARRWDIYRDPFESHEALKTYLDATSAGLMWVAARHLGEAPEPPVRDMGFATGVANWLIAVPKLEGLGRVPLVDSSDDAIEELASEALDRLRAAQNAASKIPKDCRAALLPGYGAKALLRRARKNPESVRHETLALSPFKKKIRLILQAATGRF